MLEFLRVEGPPPKAIGGGFFLAYSWAGLVDGHAAETRQVAKGDFFKHF